MKVEKMQKTHIPAVSQISAECFSEPWSEAAFAGELENPSATTFVALSGNEIIGFGGVQIISGEAYITNIAVRKEFRRKGAGGALLSAIINHSKDCSFVTLETRVSNSAAIRLYEKSGFVSQGVRKGFYSQPTEDANIMTLFLE